MSAAGAAHASQVMNAIRAMGVLVRVEAADWLTIVRKQPGALVVYAEPGFFHPSHQYLVSYKGFVFFTKSKEALQLPAGVELVGARSLYIPG